MPPLGTINNPNGRKKGTPNKVTGELRSRIKNFLEKNWAQVERDFKKLDPEKKIIFFEKLLSYAVPRMKESDLRIDFQKMSDSELDEIINRLIKNPDENTNK